MLAADYIVDIGPGAGEHGGEVVAVGTAQDIMKNKKSVTGAYLCRKNPDPGSQREEEADGVSESDRRAGKQPEEYRRCIFLLV